jgi:WW domain-binding protein 4
MQGVAGDWEMVTPSSSEIAPPPPGDASLKRSAEALDEEESREFKLRKKTMATGLGQIYDPGAISIKLKKKEEPVEPAQSLTASPAAPLVPSDTEYKPKWGKLQWKKLGDPEEQVEAPAEVDVKPEVDFADTLPKIEEEAASQLDERTTAKLEPDPAPPPESAIVFKKRKAPTGGATRGRRQGA